MTIRNFIATAAVALSMAGTLMMPAQAYYNPYYGNTSYYGGGIGGMLAAHPYVKDSLIGGGVGAAAGALLGPEGSKGSSAVKGAAVGGAAGLGVEYLREHGAFSRYSHW